MILFLDTSALVKLYVDETGGDLVLRAMQSASLIAVSELNQTANAVGLETLRSIGGVT